MPTTVIGMATRVPFVLCAATTSPNHCLKYCVVAPSLPLPVSSSSLSRHSLSLSFSSSFSSSLGLLPLSKKEGVKRVGRGFGVVAMAESKSTVLVTGAGGRTGEAFLVFALMGFLWILVFLVCVGMKRTLILDQKMTFGVFLFSCFRCWVLLRSGKCGV